MPEANPIGLGDFAMMGGYLTCLSTRSVLGVDVSEWQGKIDWQKVKATGVEFAMIRAGYRGTEHGVVLEDLSAQTNYAGATAAGIKVGAYFFSQAITVEEAVEEAEFVLEAVKGWDVQMPLVFDWEYMGADVRTGKMDSRTLTDMAKAFCDTIRAAGYEPMLYFGRSQSEEMMKLEELTDYPFWLAMYSTIMDYPYKIHMWQYTDQGTVPGIDGNVDMNLWFTYE
jgi:GH25 family lysozyme M1 (1,4-beta-N-acetylmuramidase)